MKVEGGRVSRAKGPLVIQVGVTLAEVLDENANRASGSTLPLPAGDPVGGL